VIRLGGTAASSEGDFGAHTRRRRPPCGPLMRRLREDARERTGLSIGAADALRSQERCEAFAEYDAHWAPGTQPIVSCAHVVPL